MGEVAQANRMGADFVVGEVQYLHAKSLFPICVAVHEIGRAASPVLFIGADLPDLRVVRSQ